MGNIFRILFRIALVAYVFMLFYQWFLPFPPIPEPIMFHVPNDSVKFFGETVSINEKGERIATHNVWDEAFRMIDGAQEYLLVDMSGWNTWQNVNPETAQPLAKELADHLIAAKKAHPTMAITVLVDPVNTLYGGAKNSDIARVFDAHIPVTSIKTENLRDADLIYSSFWRTFVQWFGNGEEGKLPHPLDAKGTPVSLRSWFAFMNMRGSNRVVIMADNTAHKMSVLTTALPATDRDSADVGSALLVSDHLWKGAFTAEHDTATMSEGNLPSFDTTKVDDKEGDVRVAFLHEENVINRLLRILEHVQSGDTINIANRALADRELIDALDIAAQHGAKVRLLLDPSVHWMNYAEHGIPNRAVTTEIYTNGVPGLEIRYCDLRTEICRPNMVVGTVGGMPFVMSGSAELTRRSLRDFNLTADIYAESDKEFKAHEDATKYFDMLWSNHGGAYSVDTGTYRDNPLWQNSLYRVMEATGVSTF